MKIGKFKEIIQERSRIAAECCDEWSFGIEKCWSQEIEMLSEDVDATISFLQNECTAEELSWISEIIDNLAERTRSRELLQAYKNLTDKFPEECKESNILESIKFAENVLNEDVENRGKQ
ncbi:hypothetical protein [Mogibacterium kristiansenii]|uniref:hypothetical protein n=1 Tax=Mogibacterium kristiansenii TaxID=2606708 RepID=UPI00240961D1|nr:hypothetical protein [Mogibacterium kristiansenii]MDD6700775.1 hypothetical protein [Mogibacterium kristiansenii]